MITLIPGLPDEIAEECLIRVAYNHLPLIQSVCRRWKEVVLSPYIHRRRHLAGTTRQHLVVVHSDVHCRSGLILTIFDPVYGTRRSLPFVRGVKKLFNVEIVGVGGQLLVMGRHHPSSVSIYDCFTGSWREGAPMPGEGRRYFTCISDGVKQVYVASGYQALGDNLLLSTMRYDVEEDQWENLPDMAEGGYFLQGSFQASKLYLIRGRWDPFDAEQNHIHATYFMEVYDVLSHAWSTVKLGDGLNVEYWGENCEFAIAEGGKIYCRRAEGRKLHIKVDEKWEEFVDLPANPGRGFSGLSPSKGGLVMIGLTKRPRSRWIPTLYNVYTLILRGQNQNLTWTNRQLQIEGNITRPEFWIEI